MQIYLEMALGYAQQAGEFLIQVEVISPTVGLLVGLIVGLIIHGVQRRRSRILPFLPSYSEAVDSEHDPATLFFASVHDLTMCVTEAWNTKHSRQTDAGSVESQLHHDQLYRACEGIETHGQAMMEELGDYPNIIPNHKYPNHVLHTLMNRAFPPKSNHILILF